MKYTPLLKPTADPTAVALVSNTVHTVSPELIVVFP